MSASNHGKRGGQINVTVGAASVQVLGGDPTRTAITVGAIGGTVFIKGKEAATPTNGLPIVAGTSPITLCACHVGDWVKQAIFAIADGADRSLVIIEGHNPAGEGIYFNG